MLLQKEGFGPRYVILQDLQSTLMIFSGFGIIKVAPFIFAVKMDRFNGMEK